MHITYPFRSHLTGAGSLALASGVLLATWLLVTAGTIDAAVNIISNGALETANSSGLPMGWVRGRWGTNTAGFDYPIAGSAGKGARVRITSYASGDAKWAPEPVAVEGGATYAFSDRYASDATSYVTVQITHENGSITYDDIGILQPSSSWASFSASFDLPVTAKAVSVFHLIKSVGSLSVDEYVLEQSGSVPPPPPPPPPSDPKNLIPNPSFETANSSGLPMGWVRGRWGTNTAGFDYPIAGSAGKGARVRITSYASGDAKWAFDPVKVNSGQRYVFTNDSMSDSITYVTVQFRNSSGAISYLDLGEVPASPDWRANSFAFTAPVGAVSATVFHVIKSVGTLSVDNYSLKESDGTPPPPPPQAKATVTLTFDDGWKSVYQNAIPILNSAGLKSTQYIITSRFSYPGYVNEQEVLSMQSSGHEIGSHTVTHRDLVLLTSTERKQELENSVDALRSMGADVKTIAYPFGSYNSAVIQVVQQSGYDTARSTDDGFNVKNQLVTYALKRHPVNLNTTFAQVKNLIDQAEQNGNWLVFVFHRVDYSGTTYSTTPEILRQIVDYLNERNANVVTISEGFEAMR